MTHHRRGTPKGRDERFPLFVAWKRHCKKHTNALGHKKRSGKESFFFGRYGISGNTRTLFAPKKETALIPLAFWRLPPTRARTNADRPRNSTHETASRGTKTALHDHFTRELSRTLFRFVVCLLCVRTRALFRVFGGQAHKPGPAVGRCGWGVWAACDGGCPAGKQVFSRFCLDHCHQSHRQPGRTGSMPARTNKSFPGFVSHTAPFPVPGVRGLSVPAAGSPEARFSGNRSPNWKG